MTKTKPSKDIYIGGFILLTAILADVAIKRLRKRSTGNSIVIY